MNSLSPTLYPWQQRAWQYLLQYRNADKLPHAIIVTGPSDIGKTHLAYQWAHSLLCETPASDTQQACGHCKSCILLANQTHPDYLEICPEAVGKPIKVDQIRALTGFVALTRHQSPYRLVIIRPAEQMNTNAANSLLKTLEEPPENTLLILVTSQSGHLPATIKSRCQQLKLKTPEPAQSKAWLHERFPASADIDFALSASHFAPLAAEQLLGSDAVLQCSEYFSDWLKIAKKQANPTHIAEKWLKQEAIFPINLVYTWLVDVLRVKADCHTSDLVKVLNPVTSTELAEMTQHISVKRLFGLYDKLLELIRFENSSLNKQLQLESLFIQWNLIANSKQGN